MTESIELKERIKKARKDKNITQAKLGSMLGVTQALIGQYESGIRKPKIEQLIKIANALEVDINYFLEDTDSPLIRAINSSESDSPLFDAIKQHKLTESVEFAPIDIELIKLFHQLNEKGKGKVIEYTSDLSNNKNYKGTP